MKKLILFIILILSPLFIVGCSSGCPSEYKPIYDKDGYCMGEDKYGNEWEYNY